MPSKNCFVFITEKWFVLQVNHSQSSEQEWFGLEDWSSFDPLLTQLQAAHVHSISETCLIFQFGSPVYNLMNIPKAYSLCVIVWKMFTLQFPGITLFFKGKY